MKNRLEERTQKFLTDTVTVVGHHERLCGTCSTSKLKPRRGSASGHVHYGSARDLRISLTIFRHSGAEAMVARVRRRVTGIPSIHSLCRARPPATNTAGRQPDCAALYTASQGEIPSRPCGADRTCQYEELVAAQFCVARESPHDRGMDGGFACQHATIYVCGMAGGLPPREACGLPTRCLVMALAGQRDRSSPQQPEHSLGPHFNVPYRAIARGRSASLPQSWDIAGDHRTSARNRLNHGESKAFRVGGLKQDRRRFYITQQAGPDSRPVPVSTVHAPRAGPQAPTGVDPDLLPL